MTIYLQWLPDAALVRRTLAGNRDAFGVLVQRHLPMAHALAWGHTGNPTDAEDVTQDAFLKAFTKLDTLREADKFPGWLAGIVRHRAADLRLRNQRHDTVDPDTLAHLPAPAHPLAEEETYALLREAILTLEEPAREVLTLHYFAHKPLREVAALQGISREAAMKRLQRAREALGKQLLDKLEAAPRDTPQRLNARKTAILAALATTPFAWKAAAATGSGGAVAAAVIVLSILSGLGGVVYLRSNSGSELRPQTPQPAAVAEVQHAVAPTEVSVPVEPLFRIHGRVLGLDGHPAAGASVQIERGDWDPDVPAPTDALKALSMTATDGTFAFEDLPEGRYSVAAFKGSAIDVGVANPGVIAPDWEELLVLKPGLPLAGRVVDGAGRGIVGVEVEPYAYGEGAINERELTSPARVLSGSDGAFRIGLLWPGEWTLIARAEGFPPALSERVQAGAKDAQIVLVAGGSIQGTLTNSSTSLPMSAVELHAALLTEPGTENTVKTGEDGSFHLDGLAPGDYHITTESPGVALIDPPARITVAPTQKATLELLAGGGGTISGRVIDSVTREGIPDMEIALRSGQLREYRSTDQLWTHKTDATGGYFFTGIPAGVYHLHVNEANGYLQDISWRKAPIDIAGDREVEIDYAMKRGVNIEGIVVDAHGELVEGATVHAELMDAAQNENRNWYGTSKEDGRFIVALHQGAKDIRIGASKGADYAVPLEGLSTGSEGLRGVQLKLDRTASGSVTVRVNMRGLEQAVSRSEIEVKISPEVWSSAGNREAKLSADGVATFSGVMPGRYLAMLWNNHEGLPYCEGPTFDVADGQETVVEIVCDDTHPDVAGTVRDPDGRPVAGAAVVATPQGGNPRASEPVLSDASGNFTLTGLPHDRLRIRATAPGHFEDSIQIDEDDTIVNLVLHPAREIHGRVEDAVTGAPIQNIEVYEVAADKAPATALEAINFTTDSYSLTRIDGSGGKFTLKVPANLPPALIVRCAGYLPSVQIVAGDIDDVLVFKMQEGLRVSGIVRGPDGQPVSGVTVSLEADTIGREPKSTGRTTTDITGTYSLAGLVPGATLRFTHPDFGISERMVPEGGALDVTLDGNGALVVKLARVYTGTLPAQLTVGVELPSGHGTSREVRMVGQQTSFMWERLPKGLAAVSLIVACPQVDPMRLCFEVLAVGEVAIRPGHTVELLLDASQVGQGTLLDIPSSNEPR